MIALFKKRVYDLAGIFNSKLKVTINNEKIQLKKFEDYCRMHITDERDLIIHEKKQER